MKTQKQMGIPINQSKSTNLRNTVYQNCRYDFDHCSQIKNYLQ